MRFGILGTTMAWRDDGSEVLVGGPALRALLALLLVRPGEVVTVDSLVDDLYGDRSSGDAGHALQAQISRLRRALTDVTIGSHGSGYRLAADPLDIDVEEFEALAEEGRQALTEGRAQAAADVLRTALALWRGAALADVPDAPSTAAVAMRLEERRLAALEDRLEAELGLGGHAGTVAQLRELVTQHPLRERPHGLLMRALAASGETAEALALFADYRRRLGDELGADPSPDLESVHLALLRPQPGPRMPATLTSFVGRAQDLDAVTALLTNARLVTLYGPGGVGKTRLAAEVVAHRSDVCFVPLDPLRYASELAPVMLTALGLRDTGPHTVPVPPITRLVAALSGRATLLVLDNCEHLVQAVAELAEQVLMLCPGVRILATSREPLRAAGEHLWPVSVLDESAAARLFVDRAAAVRPEFAQLAQRIRHDSPRRGSPQATSAERGEGGTAGDDETAALVAQVCRRLDGLPLAIELAAARMRTMDVAELDARLADRFAVLTRGGRTAQPRHQTLRSAVAWSWDLLSDPEQATLRRLSVFAGGCDLDAATQVCAPPGDPLDVLDSLVDRSLLVVAAGRYRMLDTVAVYADERLSAAGESDATRRAHAEHFLALARSADPRLRTAEQLTWLRVLGDERENLQAALRWAIGARDTAMGLRLVASSATYFWMRGARAVAAEHAMAVLDLVAGGPPPGLENEYLLCVLAAAASTGRSVPPDHAENAQSIAMEVRGPLHPVTTFLWSLWGLAGDEARARVTLSLAQRGRASADPWEAASAHLILAYPQLFGEDIGAAEREFAVALDGFRSLRERWGQAMVLGSLAGVASIRGEHARAVDLADDAITLLAELGAVEEQCDLYCDRGDYRVRHAVATGADPSIGGADYDEAARLAGRAGLPAYAAMASRGLGDIAYLLGDTASAHRWYEQALARSDAAEARGPVRAQALLGLARTAAAEDDLAQARTYVQRCIGICTSMGMLIPLCARAVDTLAGIELDAGDPVRAATLLGAAAALRGKGAAVEPETVRRIEAARQALGDEKYEALSAASARLGPVDALRLAGVDETTIAGSPLSALP